MHKNAKKNTRKHPKKHKREGRQVEGGGGSKDGCGRGKWKGGDGGG